MSDFDIEGMALPDQQGAGGAGIFDISDADGVNESERLLMKLCRSSFLSLWSYANLHTDQDMRDGKGSAKEFADVLVVFGNDVVIFSDKHVVFQDDKLLEVAWKRWYKRAVDASAAQLHGAKGWVTRFPNRVFQDSKCLRPLSVALPAPEQARFHLVAVTRGSREACARYFGGGSGTLVIKTDVVGADHGDTPFTVGIVSPGKAFVHVLDEFSLEVVMGEMDTARDFIDYLIDREAFLTAGHIVMAAGEEQLVSAYLTNGDEDGRRFLPKGAESTGQEVIVIDDTHYDGLLARPEYIAKREQDAPSYLWDKLIERFIRIGDPALVAPAGHAQSAAETEEGLRIIAGESRFRRRLLVDTLRETIERAALSDGRAVRLFSTKQEPEIAYVFVIAPKLDDEDYAEYRRHRMAVLHAYTTCAKLKHAAGVTFLGLAFDHPNKKYEGASEDFFVVSYPNFTDEIREELERRRLDLGIWSDKAKTRYEPADEYPLFMEQMRTSLNNLEAVGKSHVDKTKRNRAKAAKASRRINRKKRK
ncbi:hypothetical protein [Paraburkholderia bannensis]|uniref:hypothetical protein n=1 Tax=Paraburkholderia bannensis TaxID=765414 RepID=UPI002ABD6C08|nr:hypothetical protein [Paraburkholderia bannensis]